MPTPSGGRPVGPCDRFGSRTLTLSGVAQTWYVPSSLGTVSVPAAITTVWPLANSTALPSVRQANRLAVPKERPSPMRSWLPPMSVMLSSNVSPVDG